MQIGSTKSTVVNTAKIWWCSILPQCVSKGQHLTDGSILFIVCYDLPL